MIKDEGFLSAAGKREKDHLLCCPWVPSSSTRLLWRCFLPPCGCTRVTDTEEEPDEDIFETLAEINWHCELGVCSAIRHLVSVETIRPIPSDHMVNS